jgi:hypothetical protein
MSGLFFVAAKAFGAVAWGDANSKNNGRTKPVSVNFDIVVDSSGCGEWG